MLDTLDGFCDAEAQSQHIAFFRVKWEALAAKANPPL